MSWIALFVAGALEVVWAPSMKQSNGFTNLTASIVIFVAAGASFWLLAFAMKSLPLGTSYAVWTGIGAAGAFLTGIFLFGEHVTPLRVISLLLIIGGIIGLRIAAE